MYKQSTATITASILKAFEGCSNTLCLTGAGVSTASGIPDYRSSSTPYVPLQHKEFTQDLRIRQRYWARSFLGWPRFSESRPNAAHIAITALMRSGFIKTLITQNVDRLHHRSMGLDPSLSPHQSVYSCGDGVHRPLELHGTLFEVECQSCSAPLVCRTALQQRMQEENGTWRERWSSSSQIRPDGDVELPLPAYSSFTMPVCSNCGLAHLKPSVTFFGGTIPLDTVQRSLDIAGSADGVLVAGSTVSTFSAFRLVKGIAARGRPVVVVSLGEETRADPLATLRVHAEIGQVLEGLVQNTA